MIPTLTVMAAVALLGEANDGGAGPVVLVREGKPACTIVTADDPSPSAREAADDLQIWLRKSSGADVPIVVESKAPAGPESTAILVGDTKRTRALGIDPGRLGREEILLKTASNHALVVLGNDVRADGLPIRGTSLAAQVFVDRVLGVRLLWPGELGEVVPHRPTVEVRDLDIHETPRLVQRGIRDLGNIGSVLDPKLDALGWDRAAYTRFEEPSAAWFRFHRLGSSYNGDFGHAYGDYWERFHQSHPDWFALQPDGTRDNSEPAYAGYPGQQLCVSNPELIKQVAADCIDKLRKSPTLDTVSVAPNDDGPQTYCLCPKCEAWDAPDGRVVRMGSRKGTLQHVSMTDRIVRFFNAVAEVVAKELPDRYVGALAYSVYELPPVRTKVHERIIIGYVPAMDVYVNDASREDMRAGWLKWAEAAPHLFYRPNVLMALHALPTVYVHRLGEDMRLFADHNMMFVDFDCNYQHWATNGLNYYVLARLIWDPHLDVDAIVDEYCSAGFGPAAGAIRAYFDELERLTTTIAAGRHRPTPQDLARHYSDETLNRLRALLDRAAREAGDGVYRRRVDFLRQGLDYAPVSRDYQLAKEAGVRGDKWQWRKYMEQAVRRAVFFQKLGPSWAIHAPWLIYWDR